ncbi:MAG: pyruvate kinase [Pirellulales bacterium]
MSQSAFAKRLGGSRTKIVATVGPACGSEEQLADLIDAGVDVFRLNMAHGEVGEHQQRLEAIRRISQRVGRPVAVLVDLAGPKMRLGELPDGQVQCHHGDIIRFVRGEASSRVDEFVTTYPLLIDELDVNDRVMLADGTVSLLVEEKSPDWARCRVVQPGLVRSRQGVNLPGVKLSLPAMSEDDLSAAIWAASVGADFVSLSFVRKPDEIRELKALLKKHGSAARVIAKIEKPEALENLVEIVRATDGVMVARGDLGVEIDVAQMPVAQKRIISTCNQYQKPVIIATQMLDSMQHSLQPTRAEVTDVANAILDGGDACMLSGETAIGKYPRAAVEMISRIAQATEPLFRDRVPLPVPDVSAEGLHAITRGVVYGAGHIARQLSARLMVVESQSGSTALAMSKQRNYVPMVGVSGSEETLRQMCLFWGISPLAGAPAKNSAALFTLLEDWGRRDGYLGGGDRVVFVRGTNEVPPLYNLVMVYQLE